MQNSLSLHITIAVIAKKREESITFTKKKNLPSPRIMKKKETCVEWCLLVWYRLALFFLSLSLNCLFPLRGTGKSVSVKKGGVRGWGGGV